MNHLFKNMKPKEAEVTSDIRRFLKTMGIPHFKKLQGLGSPKGIADIIGCYKGRFLAIEVKRPGEKPTPDQQEFLDRYSSAGGICFVARSVDDVIQSLGIQEKWR